MALAIVMMSGVTPKAWAAKLDPVRPKPRAPAGVQALEAQLERAGARNATRATGVNNRKVVVPRGPRAGSAKR